MPYVIASLSLGGSKDAKDGGGKGHRTMNNEMRNECERGGAGGNQRDAGTGKREDRTQMF